MQTLSLTPAVSAEHPGIIALTNRAYRQAAGQAAWKVENLVTGQRIDASLLAEDLAQPGAVLLVARDAAGRRIGHVRLDDEGHDGVWYLSMLTVDPDLQDGGWGGRMLAASEAYAAARGARSMRMSVLHQRAELIAWYGRRGYAVTGETKPFPYGDARFGTPTRDDLRFEVLEKPLPAAGAALADDAPYHAHIYHAPDQRAASDALHARLAAAMGEGGIPDLVMVGALREGPVGPHPLPQFEIHFLKRALAQVLPLIEASGLRALVHPLTLDDLADHTTLGVWINGGPLDLDLSVMDPPGQNQGVARFGQRDF